MPERLRLSLSSVRPRLAASHYTSHPRFKSHLLADPGIPGILWVQYRICWNNSSLGFVCLFQKTVAVTWNVLKLGVGRFYHDQKTSCARVIVFTDYYSVDDQNQNLRSTRQESDVDSLSSEPGEHRAPMT